jgi:SAM-dependent methyltransferase
VLDLACGRGRHAQLFLQGGHPVVAVDLDVGGVGSLDDPGLEVVQADLEAGPWPLTARRFAGVVVCNYLWRPLWPQILAAVADPGVLIYETFAVGNERYGKPRNPDYLLRSGELLEVVGGELTVLAYEHGLVEEVSDSGSPRPAVKQRICAVRGALGRG